MSGRLPTTPAEMNSCSCGAATSSGFVRVASGDWMKKDHPMKEIPGPLILNAANIVYPYESMDGFRHESLYTVPIQ